MKKYIHTSFDCGLENWLLRDCVLLNFLRIGLVKNSYTAVEFDNITGEILPQSSVSYSGIFDLRSIIFGFVL